MFPRQIQFLLLIIISLNLNIDISQLNGKPRRNHYSCTKLVTLILLIYLLDRTMLFEELIIGLGMISSIIMF